MPVMPPKPCSKPGCGLYAVKHGYCEGHYVAPKAWASSYAKTKTERGYGYAWKKQRKVILERDGYLCQVCKKEGVYTVATEVDHIINKAIGGDDSPANLQGICTMCHKIKTNREKRGEVKK